MPAFIASAISLKSSVVGQSLEDRSAIRWRAPNWPPSLRSHATQLLNGNDLLDAVTAGPGDRVLVIGASAADTLCDAMRRGCRGGSALRAPPAHPDPVEVVVAPAIRTEEAGQAVVDCAHRALGAGGRVALRAMGQGAAELARQIADRLRIHGFKRVRTRGQAEGALVFCRYSGGRKVGAVR